MSETIACDELRLLIERAERIQVEIDASREDLRDVFSEAKSRGYDRKGMREILRLRKMDKHVRDEEEAVIETYKAAMGLA